MDKIAQQFQNDVVARYQQKMAALVKTAGDDAGEMQGVTKAWTQDIPETTWFENLANSAPVSALLDAAEATGVDRLADSVNDFAGNIGTGLGDFINSHDADLAAAADMESDFNTISDAIAIAKAKKNMNDMVNQSTMRPEQVWTKQLLGEPLGVGGGMYGLRRRAAWSYDPNKGLFPDIETKSPVAQGLF